MIIHASRETPSAQLQATDPAGYAFYLTELMRTQLINDQIAENTFEATIRLHTWKTFVDRIYIAYEAILNL
jgi:hypothetical protein